MMEPIPKLLNSLKTSGAKIVCYGASFIGERTLNYMTHLGLTVDYFADKYKHGIVFHGRKVISPKELAELDKQEHVCVLITSDPFLNEIFAELKKLGIRGQILRLPMSGVHVADFPLTTKEEMEHFRADALKIREQLLDYTSRKVLDSLIDARLSYLPNGYSRAFYATVAASEEKQYLLNELHRQLTRHPLSVADCGTYTGETIREMVQWGITFAESWCFEPDVISFGKLEEQLTRLGLQNRIYAVESGVHRKAGTLRFNTTATIGSRFSEDSGDGFISVISLDEYLAGKHVDFIKMDIEGSEMDALVGAECIIEHCRPILAISVYHLFL